MKKKIQHCWKHKFEFKLVYENNVYVESIVRVHVCFMPQHFLLFLESLVFVKSHPEIKRKWHLSPSSKLLSITVAFYYNIWSFIIFISLIHFLKDFTAIYFTGTSGVRKRKYFKLLYLKYYYYEMYYYIVWYSWIYLNLNKYDKY